MGTSCNNCGTSRPPLSSCVRCEVDSVLQQLNMCEGSNGGYDQTVSDHNQVAAGPPALEEAMAEPFELFVCQICLDIAYKPVVLQACGHVFCFWCIRRSMNERKPSQCPACRRAYLHFPRVCSLLHFLLEKAWPVDYHRKASETLAMEQAKAVFSPRILPLMTTTPKCSTSPASCSSAFALHDDHSSALKAGLESHGRKLHVYPERNELAMEPAVENMRMVGIEDVSCSACRKLLYRPVVINCGEVLCEGCWKAREVASSNPRWCGCGGLHPDGAVRVCLALHQYLELAFSSLYFRRRQDTDFLSTTGPGDNEGGQSNDGGEDGTVMEDDGFVHVGVGCDGCGMYPIISRNRYHCVECEGQVGYDLCQSCYDLHASANVVNGCDYKCSSSSSSSSKDEVAAVESPTSVLSVGRFNQPHNTQHRLEAMASSQRAHPPTFGAVLHFLRGQAGPLHFDLPNGTIPRRRHAHRLIMDDFDDYIDNLV